MKKQSNSSIINTSSIIIIISIATLIYFGYEIIAPILNYISKEIEPVDYISIINNFFK
jgi:hypothetical protein